jgi:hypothetical protein
MVLSSSARIHIHPQSAGTLVLCKELNNTGYGFGIFEELGQMGNQRTTQGIRERHGL